MVNENGWHPIPKYPVYEIHQDTLLVRHRVLKKILKYYTDENGYLRTNLTAGGMRKKPGQHQLVAYTFIPNPENKPEVNHKDGNKRNNSVSNLEWATQAENKAHAKKNMLLWHKLKPADVLFIRDNFASDPLYEWMQKFGVAKGTIMGIVTGRSRNEIGGPIAEFSPFKKIVELGTDQVFKSVQELSECTGRSVKSLRRMLSGERYNTTQFRYLGEEDNIKVAPAKNLPQTPTIVFNENWEQIGIYCYIQDAASINGITVADINRFMRGQCQHIKGLKFRLINSAGDIVNPVPFVSKRIPAKPKRAPLPVSPARPIIKHDAQGSIIEKYSSVGDACRKIGIDKSNFRAKINGSAYKGYFYRYAE